MAAATELAAANFPVVIFEAARTLGGRARRVQMDGMNLDNGLHILIGAYKQTLRLIEQVKLPPEELGLLRIPLELSLYPSFHLKAPRLPAPLHLAWALLRARGLSFSERLCAVRFMAKMRARQFRLDADCSVVELLAGHHQPTNTRRYLWDPLCISALNTLPAQASAQTFLNVLRDSLNGSREDSDLMLPTMDFSALFPDRAARFVQAHAGEVRLGATVDTLRLESDEFVLQPDAGRFSRVIVAVSPHRASALLELLPTLTSVRSMIDNMTYQPIYSVYLQYSDTTQLPFKMGGIEAEYSQWIFDRGQLGGPQGLIGVVISSRGAHQDLDQDELARRVHAELHQVFGVPETFLWHRVIAEKRATFTCSPGLQRPEARTSVPGLYLAGDYVRSDYPATIEGAVHSGVTAAQLVISNGPKTNN
jgi:hydroxysqualene dehydroxylase